MKVTIINSSDSRGGAAVVSLRLMEALRALGIDARMLVMHRGTDNPWVRQLQPAWRREACFLGECAYIYAHNGLNRADLFKASAAVCGMPVSRHPWVTEADAVVLGWVNQGMLSLREIARITAPIAWNMHDMWCMTGVCHHAGECPGYRLQCGNCPLLHRNMSPAEQGRPLGHWRDLSHTVLGRKRSLYQRQPITFVPVSNWLADKCRESALLAGSPIHVIPNAFPVDDFYIEPRRSRQALGLPQGKRLIVMGAARLDDPIKGLDCAIEALNRVGRPDVAAVLFGDLREPQLLQRLAIEHAWLGPITDMGVLRDIYAHASVVLSASHYETLPGTLVEGMAAGCVPVTYGRGGQADIVDHLDTGYIARHGDTADLAAGLRYALDSGIDPGRLRQTIRERFSAQAVGEQWAKLLSSMLLRPNY